MADEVATGGSAPASGSTGTGGSPVSDGGGAPAHVAITNDSLVQPPGYDKPVKWSEFSSAHVPKSEYTRKTQEFAQQQKSWAEQKAREEAELKRTAQQLAARLGGGTTDPTADLFQQLEQAPYVDGKTVAGLMRQVQQAIATRDEALKLVAGQLSQMRQGLGTIQGQSRESQVMGWINQAADRLGFKDHEHVRELLADTYRAYEGWESEADPVESLINLVKPRIDALSTSLRELDKRRAEEARRQAVPAFAKGGDARVGKPGARNAGFKTPAQIADELFPLVRATET